MNTDTLSISAITGNEGSQKRRNDVINLYLKEHRGWFLWKLERECTGLFESWTATFAKPDTLLDRRELVESQKALLGN